MTDTIRQTYDDNGGDISATVRQLTNANIHVTIPIESHRTHKRAPEDIGKPHLRKYRVSARHVLTPNWPIEDRMGIMKARAHYEAGTHEMFQEKTKCGWYILYLKPRRVPVRRENRWFVVREDAI